MAVEKDYKVNVLVQLKTLGFDRVKKTINSLKNIPKKAAQVSQIPSQLQKENIARNKAADISENFAKIKGAVGETDLEKPMSRLEKYKSQLMDVNKTIASIRSKMDPSVERLEGPDTSDETKQKLKEALMTRQAIMAKTKVAKDEIGVTNKKIASANDERIANQSAWQTLRMNTKEHGEWVKKGGKFNRTGSQIVSKTRMMTQGMKGFKMEMLGVMFFGMNLQKTFGGMLQPALQLVGALDLLRVMFELLFLPISLVLLDAFLPVMDFFTNLPEGVKLAIGGLVLLLSIIGMVLFLVGSLALGIGSLMALFAGIGGTATTGAAGAGIFSTGLTALGGAIGAIITVISACLVPILLIIGALALLWLAWQTNFANIRGFAETVFEAIGKIFEGIVDIFQGALDIIFGLIEMDGEKIMGGFGKIFDGIYKIVVEGVGAIIVGFLAFTARVIVETIKLVLGVISWFAKLPFMVAEIFVKLVGMAAKFAFDFIADILGIPDEGKKAFHNFVDGIVNIFDDLPGKIFSVIDDIIKYIDDTLGGALSGISDFLEDPLGNSIQGAGEWWHGVTGFARGGIITKPTLGLVGEAGPEAIIPLRDINNMGGSTIYNNVTVEATVASDVDIQELADVINKELQWDYRRSTMR